MVNKYQEALDTIKKAFKFRDMISAYQYNSFDVIQELIDNYSKLEKALDLACKELETHYVEHYEHKLNEYVQVYSHKGWKEYLLKESEKY